MPEKTEHERITSESKKKADLEKEFQDTHKQILKTFKERRKFEIEYLAVIKKQKKYWNDRLKETNPQKDKKRYDELKDKIKNEEILIKQIKDEIEKIDKQVITEKEHKEREKERDKNTSK